MSNVLVPLELVKNYLLEEESSPADGLQFVYATDWEGGGKYQYKHIYFYYQGQLAVLVREHSGSYFSEYHESTDWRDPLPCALAQPWELVYELLTPGAAEKLYNLSLTDPQVAAILPQVPPLKKD